MIRSNNSGFVLLYALLVASIIAIGGALLSDIIVKQIILSSVGRDSQVAYYAANAGEECARFLNRNDIFGYIDELDEVYNLPSIPIQSLNCNGNLVEVELVNDYGENGAVFSFVMSNLPNNSCSKVNVIKILDSTDDYF